MALRCPWRQYPCTALRVRARHRGMLQAKYIHHTMYHIVAPAALPHDFALPSRHPRTKCPVRASSACRMSFSSHFLADTGHFLQPAVHTSYSTQATDRQHLLPCPKMTLAEATAAGQTSEQQAFPCKHGGAGPRLQPTRESSGLQCPSGSQQGRRLMYGAGGCMAPHSAATPRLGPHTASAPPASSLCPARHRLEIDPRRPPPSPVRGDPGPPLVPDLPSGPQCPISSRSTSMASGARSAMIVVTVMYCTAVPVQVHDLKCGNGQQP